MNTTQFLLHSLECLRSGTTRHHLLLYMMLPVSGFRYTVETPSSFGLAFGSSSQQPHGQSRCCQQTLSMNAGSPVRCKGGCLWQTLFIRGLSGEVKQLSPPGCYCFHVSIEAGTVPFVLVPAARRLEKVSRHRTLRLLRCSFKVVKVQTACSVATFKELLRRHLERRWGLLVLVIGVVRFDIDMSVFSGTKQSRSVKPVSRCPALQFFPGPYVVVAQPVFGHARGVRRSLQVGVSK